ncbi:MAG: extracellular solute-binding protein [Oscillospiraceae bacterium]|jgi:multiple sugar transport system substrate-binding protein|nr:extracellular solute-binding protein [Oscillospiraceae bacterium]
MNSHRFSFPRRAGALLVLLALVFTTLGACSIGKPKFDPKNPVVITVWHYYNGTVLDAFDALVQRFNETVGMDKGIIVEGYAYGSVSELENNVIASVNKEVGSAALPNVFASYADTAYAAEKVGILANLDDYFTKSKQEEYADSYIEEGKIGFDGELRIFPIAKSTEVFMLNDTDWKPFAEAYNLSYDNLTTLESLAEVSKQYYEWTDARTPDVPNDGKAFYGRDSTANMFIIGSMEFGEEIFQVEGGKGEINVSEKVMRKFWDCYYVPYISGYFSSYGRYRSDDVKTGELLSYIGSTSSSEFFPASVTVNDATYPIDCKIMPVPHFENSEKYLVQQGAGMVVTKNEPLYELASAEFLKWFTDVDNNTVFSALSGYMPVKKAAISYEFISEKLKETGQSISVITDETLRIALVEMSDSKLYTNKAFEGGAAARNVLGSNLQNKAVADREKVINLLDDGASLKDAVAGFASDEQFAEWLAAFEAELQKTIA